MKILFFYAFVHSVTLIADNQENSIWLSRVQSALEQSDVRTAEHLLLQTPNFFKDNPATLLNVAREYRMVFLEAYYCSLKGEDAPILDFVEPLIDHKISAEMSDQDIRQIIAKAGDGDVLGIGPGSYGRIGLNNRALIALDKPENIILERIGSKKGMTLIAGITINPPTPKFPTSGFYIGGGSVVIIGCKVEHKEQETITGFSARGNSQVFISYSTAINCNPGFISWTPKGMSLRHCSSYGNENGTGFVSADKGILEADTCLAENHFRGFHSIGDSTMHLNNSTASGNTNEGKVASSRSRLEARNSTAIRNGKTGFKCVGHAQMKLQNCRSTKNEGHGFRSFGSASLTGFKCFASENGGCGFISQVASEMHLIKCHATSNVKDGFKSDPEKAVYFATTAKLLYLKDCKVGNKKLNGYVTAKDSIR